MRRLLCIVGLVVALSGTAMAAIEAGMKEIAVQFSFQEMKADEDNALGTYSAIGQLTLNYFMASHWSFGLQTMLNVNASETTKPDGTKGDMDPSGTAFLMARTDLYLGGAEWSTIPYIGGHGGYSMYAFKSGDTDTEWSSEMAYGGQGGLKIFASERISWNIEGDLTIFEAGESSMDDDMKALGIEPEKTKLRITSLLLGFSYYF